MTPEEITTVEYAIRYCITRISYAYEDGLRLADKHWDELSIATKLDVINAVRARGREHTPIGLLNVRAASA